MHLGKRNPGLLTDWQAACAQAQRMACCCRSTRATLIRKHINLMAVDMFIKIDTVDGEAQDTKHKKEIDVLSWSWGMTNSGSAHIGGGAGAGKVNVQDLTFTKWVDSATPKLALACCSGQHFQDAVLVVRKAGEKPVEYLKIKMDGVFITSLSTGGSGGEDRLTENVTLNFSKVSLDYIPQSDKGSAGTAIPMSWDITANENS
jgi:type VI secretion system secreted protein Hcp